MLRRMECGSARCGPVSEGCVRCIEGSKMVLLVTGKCGWGCDYCPVSLEKKGLDVVYANEGRVFSDEEVISEAESMDARGTGITGGDPLVSMDRTLHYIRLLKERFGPDHQIHLYTATMDPEKVRLLEEAGLDEIRFHPMEDKWSDMASTRLAEIAGHTRMKVGIEVPALPGREADLIAMVQYARSVGVDFVNLNELEFSESNWDMMDIHGYSVKDDVSSAVAGSEETAMKVLKKARGMDVHFCSSAFKDGIQLRRRLIRRAIHISEPYQQVTEDGTLVRGFVKGEPSEVASELESLGVPSELYVRTETGAEVAPWVLEDISGSLAHKAWLSEQYPTADGLEVERTPLNRGEPSE
ncbi:MAG: radical SAM protein [Thermoplasmata archaeon]|nr:radical SAM protein [Thermoplasmata archaeon]